MAARARETDSGSSLLGRRINVEGKGPGTVLDVRKRLFSSTKHVVLFDGVGVREALVLSKRPADSSAMHNKGFKFYLLEDEGGAPIGASSKRF